MSALKNTDVVLSDKTLSQIEFLQSNGNEAIKTNENDLKELMNVLTLFHMELKSNSLEISYDYEELMYSLSDMIRVFTNLKS